MNLRSFRIALSIVALSFSLSAPVHAYNSALGETSICTPDPAAHIAVSLSKRDTRNLRLARTFEQALEEQDRDPAIVKSIYRASLRTNVDFRLMLLKAIMESDLGRLNVAARSSARGVYQYIEPTWLILMKRYGAEVGYPEYTKVINIGTKTGTPYLNKKDRYLRSEILALRHNPDIAAMIKGYQIREETDTIAAQKGNKVTITDHYIAHMLGLSLTEEFYDLMNKNSIFAVARLGRPEMREAAKLNRPFFYNKRTPLRAPDVYKRFEKRVNFHLAQMDKVSKAGMKKACTTAGPLKVSLQN